MSDMAQLISVKLSRFDGSPWGFRLQGGKDFGTPLVVQKVNGGSPAEAAGLRAGDAVIKVNNTDTYNLKHKDAQDVIVKAGNSFEVTVQRGGNTWRPSVSPVTPSIPSPQPHAPVNNIPPVTKTSLAANKQDVQHIGSGHNFAPKPFSNGNSDGAPIKSIVNKQYNSPVGIYSEQTIAETLSAQAEVLAGGVLGVNFKKNEKNYDAQNSEVFRMVQEADKEPKTPEPVCSRAEYYGTISHAIGGCATSSRSATPLGRSYHGQYQQPPSSASSYAARDEYYDHLRQEQSSRASTTSDRHDNYEITVCHGCDNPIVGLFVRIKEKNLHVECFKCSTCGTSLKNVGYYNINNKLYCDIHAKLVARQQSTQGSIPTTVSTGGGKAPVGTITAALGNLGIDSPKSPPPPPQPLNGTSITAPFALQNYNRRPNSDLGNLPRGYIRPAEYITDNNNEENKKICDEKIYTSTITIKTGNEVGINNDKNKNECIDNNKNQTNKFIIMSQVNPTIKNLSNDKSSSIICAPVVSKENSQNKAIVELHIKPECQVTNQTNKSPIFISSNNNNTNNKIHTFKKPIVNNNGNDKIDFSRSQFNPQDYNIYLNNHKEKFSGVISALGNNNNNINNIKNDTFKNYFNRVNNNNNYNSLRRSFNVKSKFKNGNGVEKKIDKIENINGNFFNSNIINNNKNNSNNNNKDSMIKVDAKNVKNYINSANFTSSASSLAAFLLANRSSHPETLYCSQRTPPRMPTPPNSTSSSSSVSSSSSSPPPPPPPLLPLLSSSTTTSSSWTNHLGNQPNDTPTYRPLQTPTLGGGNKSIGSTGLAPTLNYSSANNNNNNNNSSSINSFIRPQSQTVTVNDDLNNSILNGKRPICCDCGKEITRGPFITALGQIWCPEHFVCVNSQCNRPLQDIGFVQEKGQLYCEYCFERFIAPACNKCNNKIKGDSLTAIGKHFHPECFSCTYCGKLFGNSPFFLEDGLPYCEADWNELFTTKCYACGFPVEAGDRWVEALNNNYHSQCFNCSTCKANLEGQSFYAKGGRPFCKNHAR
ncbi:PDZ and LIM domain protein Zasp isoform X13 [Aphidius gifuensis]|uniref:PDZ and LIM domain protein Zasp isoform X13 n=1 Tax=Aphidius gifuensis TaxID=684658 RepID=UPI001CDCEBB3|nr:PDZ and LIM domain protein Zasp isoform X13 [Aphidius gifuensis]